jgi:adenylate kinase family enzyme
MERIVVVGSSGSGKTTLARRLSEALELPHLELDSVFHRGGWGRLAGEPFRREVAAFVSQPRWVVDGNYTSQGARELLWPRADTIVWLDLPRAVMLRRVITRTLRRVITREELWEGVREPWTNLYSPDPEHNIIVWAWTRFDQVRHRFATCMADGAWDHTEVHRLRTPAEADAWLEAVEGLEGSLGKNP